jgi:hypothetical protein
MFATAWNGREKSSLGSNSGSQIHIGRKEYV